MYQYDLFDISKRVVSNSSMGCPSRFGNLGTLLPTHHGSMGEK
jgi:hypothetical protein